MAIARLQAATREQISFEFGSVSEIKLNSVPPYNVPGGIPYAGFQINSDFITSAITISISIPNYDPIPRNVIVKLNNYNDSVCPLEYREIVINCNEKSLETKIDGIIIVHASSGRPRSLTSYIQTAEFVFNYGNYSKTLVCPISRKSIFNMCFYRAYEAQGSRVS